MKGAFCKLLKLQKVCKSLLKNSSTDKLSSKLLKIHQLLINFWMKMLKIAFKTLNIAWKLIKSWWTFKSLELNLSVDEFLSKLLRTFCNFKSLPKVPPSWITKMIIDPWSHHLPNYWKKKAWLVTIMDTKCYDEWHKRSWTLR